MAEQKKQDTNQLLKVRREKLADLQANGKDPFQITKFDQTHHSLEVKNLYEAHEAEILKDHKTPDVEGLDEAQAREVLKQDYEERRKIMDANPIHVAIAGRMMFKRVMGKASFCNIQDLQGNIQVYVARDAIGEESYADFKKSDIGDIFGLEGFAFRTRTGEISIHAEKMTMLTKSLQILPEKFHGLTDTDTRYRQRYVDLIMNQDSKNVFIKRSQILKEIRNFLAGRDFMEVETPMLVSNAGGAAARPFETHYNALNEDVKLRISLELYLKRLIVGGLERVYEIGRVFRNEGVDTRHNPEFTLMELYQAYTDYEGMMELTESMFRYLAEKVCGSTKISYNGVEIDLGKPFARMTMNEAIKKYAGIDFDEVADDEAAKKLADEHHIEYEAHHKKGDIINLFFEEYCEKELIQPTFIMDHPIEISPLTKKKPSDPSKVERFELFCNTWEMCNAYSELNDPIDQRERFKAQDALADAGDEEANHTDEDFLNALEIGMPPTGGIGYGIDRLVMLLTDSQAIRDVLLFPTMKSLDSDKNASKADVDEAPAANDNNGFFTPNEKINFSNVKIEPLFEEAVDFDTFSKSDFRAVKVKECVAVPKSKKLLQFTLDDGTGTDRTILSGIHSYYEPEELVGKTLIAITNLPPRKMMGIESCGMLLSAVNNLKDSEDEELHLLMVDNHIPAGAKLY
ncbi:lysine--tRNA ligase [Blautia obeum]|uniref:lysine--tRNA ligase n=1 Tax=Blautia obeum TaxID=40520 RepID=UPI000E4C338F|nr:lysine--tRNA ligase [Blautia obeum]NSC71840.1 lysine--tRNA ligase [Blautia obeum]RGS12096.1 lysine--tRNA ligase [Blautia obeum]RHC81428.1 lysine--tRNA ligase [Blautia obeum]